MGLFALLGVRASISEIAHEVCAFCSLGMTYECLRTFFGCLSFPLCFPVRADSCLCRLTHYPD